MVRKTKEDAELTRQQLLNAARAVFSQRGVSRTTMEQVACAAGVTRGALYWHFANKEQLFFAMFDEITGPLLSHIEDPNLSELQTEPLAGIERFLLGVFQLLEQDPCIRQAYEIVSGKCEYVDEFARVPQRLMERMAELTRKLTAAYSRAQALGQLKPGLDPEALALDTCVFFSGLFRSWLVDREQILVGGRIAAMVKTHLALRARWDPAVPARR